MLAPRRLPVCLVVLALLAPPPALAHAILMESAPAIGATIPPGPTHIALRYNSRIDQGRSRLELRTPGASPTLLHLEPSPDDTLVTNTPLTPGDYTVRWQVLAVDGHITRGDVPITVAPPPAQPPAVQSQAAQSQTTAATTAPAN